MVTTLERIVPEAPGRPDMPPMAEVMQQVTREIAFDPASWTPDRAAGIVQIFDGMAATWGERAKELRHDALHDAIERGGVPDGLVLEVGSGTGIFTTWLTQRFGRLVALDLSMEMLRMADPSLAPRVCADASRLPVPDGRASGVVLVNCFLFPAECDRVLAPDGVLVWVSALGDRTPIYLPADDVARALPGEWDGVASQAGWGSWAVVRRTAARAR